MTRKSNLVHKKGEEKGELVALTLMRNKIIFHLFTQIIPVTQIWVSQWQCNRKETISFYPIFTSNFPGILQQGNSCLLLIFFDFSLQLSGCKMKGNENRLIIGSIYSEVPTLKQSEERTRTRVKQFKASANVNPFSRTGGGNMNAFFSRSLRNRIFQMLNFESITDQIK